MKKFLSFFLISLMLPFLAFAEKPHWISTQIVDLTGNTYNSFTSVSLPSTANMYTMRIRQNPPTGWINSCELRVSTVSSPNTYTANYGYSSIPPSTENMVNERTFYNNSQATFSIYMNLSQSAKALVEIDKFYLYLK